MAKTNKKQSTLKPFKLKVNWARSLDIWSIYKSVTFYLPK